MPCGRRRLSLHRVPLNNVAIVPEKCPSRVRAFVLGGSGVSQVVTTLRHHSQILSGLVSRDTHKTRC